MTLPYQVPLYESFGQIREGNYGAARRAVEGFFRELETDAGVRETRRQHFERQVFEPDFVSILLKEEIDAIAVLTYCDLAEGKLNDAYRGCLKQFELIDDFYCFSKASIECSIPQIPLDRELAQRYSDVCGLLAEIWGARGDDESRQRWESVRKAALGQHDPEVVWQNWISCGEDLSPHLPPYFFLDWRLQTVSIAGKTALAQHFAQLGNHLSPHVHKWLVEITIPTETTAEVPSKKLRWKIWALRQAIHANLRAHELGILGFEMQSRGERKIGFYVSDAAAAKTVIVPVWVGSEAAQLGASVEVREDLGWHRYTECGGASVLLDTPAEDDVPHGDSDDDEILRKAWMLLAEEANASTRVYYLSWLINSIAPPSPVLRKYCVDYLFSLVRQMDVASRLWSLMQMLWKLSAVDADAAIRAFDALIVYKPFEEGDHCMLNLACVEFARVDPDRALVLANAITDYPLVFHSFIAIAEEIAKRGDRKRAAQILLESYEKYCQDHDYLKGIANDDLLPPDVVLRYLRKATAHATGNAPERFYRFSGYYEVLQVAVKRAPGYVGEIMRLAIDTAFAVENPEHDANAWIDPCGPEVASGCFISLAEVLAEYDSSIACEMLLRAIENAAAIEEPRDRARKVEEFAGALQRIGAAASDNVVKAFAKFLTAVLNKLELPEQSTYLQCLVAVKLRDDHRYGGPALVARAQYMAERCSSKYLTAIARSQVAAAMEWIGVPGVDKAWSLAFGGLAEVSPETTQFEAYVKSANAVYIIAPARAAEMVRLAAILASTGAIDSGVIRGAFDTLPARLSGRYLLGILRDHQDERTHTLLCQWANRFE